MKSNLNFNISSQHIHAHPNELATSINLKALINSELITSVNNVTISFSSLDLVIKTLHNDFNLNFADVNDPKMGFIGVSRNEKCTIYMERSNRYANGIPNYVYIWVLSTGISIDASIKLGLKITSNIAKITELTEERIEIIELFESNGEIEQYSRIIDTSKYKIINELYPDLDIEILINDYFSSKGSLLVLFGPPGTGKTTFIKATLKRYSELCFESKATHGPIAYIKDLNMASKASLWSNLTDKAVVIFDDLDPDYLLPRDRAQHRTDSAFVSNLLSFSDSIFQTNVKIIITINQVIDKIDSALVRSGRCFDFLEVRKLSPDHARDIWTKKFKLSEETFIQNFSRFKEIAQSSLIAEAERESNNKLERAYIRKGNRHYCLESKLEELDMIGEQSTRKTRLI